MKVADNSSPPALVVGPLRSPAASLAAEPLRQEFALAPGVLAAERTGSAGTGITEAFSIPPAPRQPDAEVPRPPSCPALFARFVRESYGRSVNPLRCKFSFHA